MVDKDDSSLTRSNAYMLQLFEQAGVQVGGLHEGGLTLSLPSGGACSEPVTQAPEQGSLCVSIPCLRARARVRRVLMHLAEPAGVEVRPRAVASVGARRRTGARHAGMQSPRPSQKGRMHALYSVVEGGPRRVAVRPTLRSPLPWPSGAAALTYSPSPLIRARCCTT